MRKFDIYFYWLVCRELCSQPVTQQKVKFWNLTYTLCHTPVEGRYADRVLKPNLPYSNVSRYSTFL